ncbi:MAG: hypothetical protein Q4A16_07845 [Lautropia sp.]|nr:hypothetical protein [Lautropia sp.]
MNQMIHMAAGGGATHPFWLWFCMCGGLLVCVAIVIVTIRRQMTRRAFSSDRGAAGFHASLGSEIFWVMIPISMIVLLGGWILVESWPGCVASGESKMHAASAATAGYMDPRIGSGVDEPFPRV